MALSDDELRDAFDDAVTMSSDELREWLETEESHSVGEPRARETGRLIATILDKDEPEDDDLPQLRRTVRQVQRALGRRPDGDVTHTDWRYALMNLGHDPLAD